MTINKREQGIEQILDLRRIEQELGTRRFRNFVALGWKVAEPARPFIRSWHTDAIADHLQAVTEGQIKRLLINVPPGHGKSLLVSVLWPAWQWIAHPQLRGICTSYDHDLSVRDSVRCRGVLTSRWYQETFRPGWRFTDDQNAKDWFVNDHQGFRMALAVGGKGTGFRGDYIIVDDPLNARKQHSDAALNDVTFWFDQAMSSRLNDPSTGSIVIIMQRLSERDLAGHVLARDTYEHLNLSTEYEPERRCVTCLGHPDPRTHEGELLFPHLFPASAIAEAKQVLGSQGFSAQHQQRPAPAEGGIFKRQWWRFWKPRDVNLPPIRYRDAQGVEHEAVVVVLPEELDEGIQSWDCSFKNQANSDYVAGEVWGRCGANVYLLDQVHRRMDFPETLQAIRDMTRRWPGAGLKLIEDRANGTAVIQSLSRELGGIVAVQPLGGKTARAQAITPRIEAGNVYLPHPAHRGWADDFIEECAQFPFGRHDDWVDAMTQAIARLNVPSQSRAAEPDPEDDDFSYLSNPWRDNLFVQSRMQGHTDPVSSVAFSPDGKALASASYDKTVRLWDVVTRRPLGQPLQGHMDPVYSVAFSRDGKTLASASWDKTVRLWDVETRQPLGEPLQGHTNYLASVVFSPDDKTLASASWDKTVRLWDVATRRPLGEPLQGHADPVSSVAFSPDGKTLVSASYDKTVRLWDVVTRRPLGQPLQGHTNSVYSVAFSPDGKTLASASWDKTVRLWDVATRWPLGEPLQGHTDYVVSVAFSPDGKTLASAGYDKTVRLWDMATRRPLGEPLQGHTAAVNSVAFSPDGRTLASASWDKTVRLWDVVTRRPLGEPLQGHTDYVVSVAFSPDGKTLASASLDESVRLWDVAIRRSLGEPLQAHTNYVYSVAFSPDGKTLASASWDKTVRLWDVATRRPLGEPLQGHTAAVNSVAFSPDGKTLASASMDKTVRLWNVDPESWISRICQVVNRNLSMLEWRDYIGESARYRLTCPALPPGNGAPKDAGP